MFTWLVRGACHARFVRAHFAGCGHCHRSRSGDLYRSPSVLSPTLGPCPPAARPADAAAARRAAAAPLRRSRARLPRRVAAAHGRPRRGHRAAPARPQPRRRGPVHRSAAAGGGSAAGSGPGGGQPRPTPCTPPPAAPKAAPTATGQRAAGCGRVRAPPDRVLALPQDRRDLPPEASQAVGRAHRHPTLEEGGVPPAALRGLPRGLCRALGRDEGPVPGAGAVPRSRPADLAHARLGRARAHAAAERGAVHHAAAGAAGAHGERPQLQPRGQVQQGRHRRLRTPHHTPTTPACT